MRFLETSPSRSSSLAPVMLSVGEVINAVAGRMALCTERPTHPKGVDSLRLGAKRSSHPLAELMWSGVQAPQSDATWCLREGDSLDTSILPTIC